MYLTHLSEIKDKATNALGLAFPEHDYQVRWGGLHGHVHLMERLKPGSKPCSGVAYVAAGNLGLHLVDECDHNQVIEACVAKLRLGLEASR